ncbi:MAG: hypothetical protein AB1646_24715 [Thermodesulfobacteriota bacterium]
MISDDDKARYALEAFAACNVVSAGVLRTVFDDPVQPSVGRGIWGTIVLGNQLFKGALEYGADQNPDREYALCKAAFGVCLGMGSAVAIGYYIVPRLGLAAAPGIATALAMNWLMGRTTKDLYDDIHLALGYVARDGLAAAEYLSKDQGVLTNRWKRTALLVNELLDLTQDVALTAVKELMPEHYNEAMQLANDFSRQMADLKGTVEAWQDELLQTMHELLAPLVEIASPPDPGHFRQLLMHAADLARGVVGDLGPWHEILQFIVNAKSPGESYCDARPLTAPETPAPAVYFDPLVLDLDGDRIETTREGRSWAAGRAFFDLNADTFAERTGWVSGNDGLLVMDRNGDGIINSGRELFGSETIMSNGKRTYNSFRALADLDSNRDGRIAASDAQFFELRVWKDTDEDGFSFPLELYTLEELGITAINLNYTFGSGKDQQGNTQELIGSFTWAEGTTAQIAECVCSGILPAFGQGVLGLRAFPHHFRCAVRDRA